MVGSNASGPEGSRALPTVLCRRCLGSYLYINSDSHFVVRFCCETSVWQKYLINKNPEKRDYKAAFAFSTIEAKTSGSFIARSARIFLSKSIFAFFRPLINLE